MEQRRQSRTLEHYFSSPETEPGEIDRAEEFAALEKEAFGELPPEGRHFAEVFYALTRIAADHERRGITLQSLATKGNDI